MTWIALLFFVEAGFTPNAQEWNHGNPDLPWLVEREVVSTDVGARLLLFDDLLFVEASVQTLSSPSDHAWTLSPYRDVYQFGGGISWRGFELGWLHECSHPVATNWQEPGGTENLGREWAFDRFYISYEGKITILED